VFFFIFITLLTFLFVFFHFHNVTNVPFCFFSLVTAPGTLKLYVNGKDFEFFLLLECY
jgi:hypothetical protein